MDHEGPDLEAFGNICPIILAREIAKNVAFVSNLHSNTSDPQSAEESSHNDTNKNAKVAHHLIPSLIQTFHLMILKHP